MCVCVSVCVYVCVCVCGSDMCEGVHGNLEAEACVRMCLRMFATFCVVVVPLCGAVMSLQRHETFCGSAPRPFAATATARKKE